MTELELKYLIALQPKIKEAMGPVDKDDLGFCLECESPTMCWLCEDFINYPRFPSKNFADCKARLRFPDIIARESDTGYKRGLIDMLNDFRSVEFNKFNYMWTVSTYNFSYENSSLVFALLRALAHQWGIEVEG